MNLRKLFFRLTILLIAILTANAAFAQAYSIRVTQGGTDDPLDASPVPLIAGNPFEVRVAVLDGNGELYTSFNRDVTLELRGMFRPPFSQSSISIPAADFLDGVAEFVEVVPEEAGTDIMRFWATDGNITTDNASGYFSIAPARFAVTYSGGNQPLQIGQIVAGTALQVRVRAVNPNGTTAIGYTGLVGLESVGMDATGPFPEFPGTASASITFGGFRDDVSISFSQGTDVTISAYDVASFDGSHYTTFTADASGFFDVEQPGGGEALTVGELQRSGDLDVGTLQDLRYRLNNETDDDIPGPVDTLFRLMRGNDLLLQWTERYDPESPVLGEDEEPIFDENGEPVLTFASGTDSGPLWTSFILPEGLTEDDYTIQVRPGLSEDNEETLDFSLTTTGNLAIQQFDYPPGEYRGGDVVRFDLSFLNQTTYTNQNIATTALPFNEESRYKVRIHLSSNFTYGDADDFLVWEGAFVGNMSLDDESAAAGGPLYPGQQIDVRGAFMLPDNFDGQFFLLARVNAHGGRAGQGFAHENFRGTTAVWGDNTTFGREAQKITILPRSATDTSRVSVTSGGGQSGGESDNPAVSGNGRFVAFESFGGLAGTVAGGTRNIFVRDLREMETILVTEALVGAANGHSGHASINGDGRYIAFHSNATNLVENDTNGHTDIFVRDLALGVTVRVSVNPNATDPSSGQGNHGSQLASISGDGRFIVFESSATNLVSPQPGGLVTGRTQIYLVDRDVAGTGVFNTPGNVAIRLVSQVNGFAGSSASTTPVIARDGRFVAFVTRAPNLLGTNSPFEQVVRWERATGRIIPVSLALNGEALGNNSSGFPAISGNGEYIAFASSAQNMTEDLYEQSIPHLFRARIQSGLVSGMIRMNAFDGSEPNNPPLFNVPDLGSYKPALSDDGLVLVFTSESDNLLPPIMAHNVDRTMIELPTVQNYTDDNNAADVYRYDLTDSTAPLIRRASVSRFGFGTNPRLLDTPGLLETHVPLSRSPAISADGRFIAFTSEAKGFNGLIFGATNWEFSATNAVRDIYVFDLKDSRDPVEDPGALSIGLTVNKEEVVVGETIQFNVEIEAPFPPLAGVRLYGNGIFLAEMTAVAGSQGGFWTWQGELDDPGAWSVHAMATDIGGNRSYSAPVEIEVVMLRLTASATAVSPGVPINLEVIVLGGSPEISFVDFFVNAIPIHRENEAPFRVMWTPQEVGDYIVTFVARDHGNNVDHTANSIRVTVYPPTLPSDLLWRETQSGTDRHLNGLVYSDGRFVVVGAAGAVLESDSGEVWSVRPSPTTAALNAVTAGFGHLVAVGDGGTTLVSNDLQSWTPLSSNTTTRLTGVTFGHDIFVAVGNSGRISTLSDLSGPWSSRNSGTAMNLNSVTYGNGTFVAVGSNGTVLHSPDGKTWTQANSGTSAPLHSVAYGNGQFVGVGGYWDDSRASFRGVVLTSPDGSVWAQYDPGIPRILYGVGFGGGQFTLAGAGGSIALSVDGVSWTRQTTATTTTLFAAGFGAGQFVAVGREGTIWRAGTIAVQNWLAQHFSLEERDDPGIGTLEADPGNYGITNLVRYALALDPRQPDRKGLPQPMVWQGNPSHYPAMIFTRRAGGEDILFVLEESTNLTDWEVVSDAKIVSTSVDGDVETVVLRSSRPMGEGQNAGFLRLRMVWAP